MRNPVKDQVAIVGVGVAPYTRQPGAGSSGALAARACVAAIRDAGLAARDIDGVCGSSYADVEMQIALGLPEVTWGASPRVPFCYQILEAVNAVYAGACTTAIVYHSTYRRPGTRELHQDPLRERASAFGASSATPWRARLAMGPLEPGTQGGGVGYYPSSGSPFVHFDVGNVRHWPKMSRRELIALFPDGKTLHVPSDGKPLPGFEQALASYQARKKSGNVAIASLGKSTSSSSSSRSGGFLAAFFGGGGADDEEDSSTVDVASGGDDEGAAAPAAQPKAVKADAKATAKAADNKIRIIPPELANPVDIPAAQQQETIVAALPARDVPLPLAAPRPQVDVGAVDQTSMGLYSTEQTATATEPAMEPEVCARSGEARRKAMTGRRRRNIRGPPLGRLRPILPGWTG